LIDLEIRTSAIDFDKVWTEPFEEWYWHEYRPLSTTDAGRARYQLRGDNREFDALGVQYGLWKAYDPSDWRAKAGYIPPPPKPKQKVNLPKPT